MTTVTPLQQQTYRHMQARLILLLPRYDKRRFGAAIGSRPGTAADLLPDLQYARDLAVLFHLQAALFDDILPRIVRRLSFAAPRKVVVEEPPVRGRIAWDKTLAALWDEYPDGVPLELHTRQRRRNFATPENLLTVATLLEFRATVQRLLNSEAAQAAATYLDHPLHALIEQCERELAFPQFVGIQQEAQQVLANDALDMLEQAVRERLLPGSNSAYEDLLHWRELYRTLRLLQLDQQADDATVGADPKRDNYLYQLWICYELVDLLHRLHCAPVITAQPADDGMRRLVIHFQWGNDDPRATYELRHDQEVPNPLACWHGAPHVPGVRPDFYIRRVDPPPATVQHNGAQVWREPGEVWDAKYYRDAADTPGTPDMDMAVKRMLADLQLLGESRGVLLFAILPEDEDNKEIRPNPAHAQTIQPDPVITIRRLAPAADDAGVQAVHNTLRDLLDATHARLGTPTLPQCHGVFLDSMPTANTARLRHPDGSPVEKDAPADLLLCPKPHIGAWRVDVVSRTRHCCTDPQWCHIVGQAGIAKPLRTPRTIEDLLKEMEQIRHATPASELTDEQIAARIKQVEDLTRQLARMMGVNIAHFVGKLELRGLDARTLERLSDYSRESLAMALFLEDQLGLINANDYSAPTIHIGSAVEFENRRLIFATCLGLVGELAQEKGWTLGKLAGARYYARKSAAKPAHEKSYRDTETETNWQQLQAHAATHWDGSRACDEDNDEPPTFDHYAEALHPISETRNAAAHTGTVPRESYIKLTKQVFQQARGLPRGALNTLLLAWQPPA